MSSLFVSLAEIASINPTAPKGQSSNDEYAFIPMAAVEADLLEVSPQERLSGDEIKPGLTYFEDGDILVAKITPCFENGKIALVRTDGAPGFGSTEFHVVRASDRVDRRYLAHFLRMPIVRRVGEGRMTGSAGQKRIPRNFIEQLKIPLPPLEEQLRIAAILDAADALRAKRRAALAKLDTLAQSIFIEMFGDLIDNDRNWRTGFVSDLVAGFESGKNLVGNDENQSEGYRVLKVSAVTSGRFEADQSKPLPLDYVPPVRHLVRQGDLLFSRANTALLVGATALVEQDVENLALPDKLWRFVWHSPNVTNPEFILNMFQSRKFREEVSRRGTGTSGSMKNVSQDKVLSIQLGIPPSSLQARFAQLSKAVRGQREFFLSGSYGADALFASLQHRAFRGELTAADEKVAAA